MIVDAMSLAQLQTTRHLLQEMEADGIRSLSDARRRLERAEGLQHAERIRRGRSNIVRHTYTVGVKCPDCGRPTEIKPVGDEMIRYCVKCRWSELVEG